MAFGYKLRDRSFVYHGLRQPFIALGFYYIAQEGGDNARMSVSAFVPNYAYLTRFYCRITSYIRFAGYTKPVFIYKELIAEKVAVI